MKNFGYSLIVILNFVIGVSYAQESPETKSVKSLTIFYIDNSQTSAYSKLNMEAVENLKERIEALKNDETDFFLAYLCIGEESKFSANEEDFLDKLLPEFLDKKIRNVNYAKDREMFRDFFTVQSSLKVRNSIEINFYLSACSVYNLKNRIVELPAPISLLAEFPIYLSDNSIQIKVNYFITTPSESVMDNDFNQTIISEILNFYSAQMMGGKIHPKIQFF